MDLDLINAIIFDLDGTLVDSKKSLEESFKKTTEKLIPEKLKNLNKIMIGPPLKDTVKNIIGNTNKALIDKYISEFKKIHDNTLINKTTPYKNVEITLKKLQKKNIILAVATNKRQIPTLKIIKNFGWEKYFYIIKCSDEEDKIKTKTQLINEIIKLNSIFSKSFFIGDTVGDAVASYNNNLKFLKANYGYGKNDNWSNTNIFSEINDIKEVMKYV
jgi:phosphoglycolate phosphatase